MRFVAHTSINFKLYFGNIHGFDENLLKEAATPSHWLLDPVLGKSTAKAPSMSSVSNNPCIENEGGTDKIIEYNQIRLEFTPLQESAMEHSQET